MATIVFDIEVAGLPWEEVDEITRGYLLQRARTDGDRDAVPERTALYPCLGKVIAIGMWAVEKDSGYLLLEGKGEASDYEKVAHAKLFRGSESELLAKFWEIVAPSDKPKARLVTFNGRGYDGPVLMLRSAQLGVKATRLGSYSTPLNLFNHLQENHRKVSVLDDVAGLFYDRAAMATLKAATWPSPDGRIISWGSATSKANIEDFEFHGKLIIICNSFPSTPDAIAIKSRSLTHQFQISKATAMELLREAAADSKWFKNIKRSQEVAEFLCEHLTDANLPEISYRTLHMAYDAAENMPGKWKLLVGSMIHVNEGSADPEVVIKDLNRQGIKVGEQIRIFEEMTGFKRRTFFKYRKQIGVVKSNRAAAK